MKFKIFGGQPAEEFNLYQWLDSLSLKTSQCNSTLTDKGQFLSGHLIILKFISLFIKDTSFHVLTLFISLCLLLTPHSWVRALKTPADGTTSLLSCLGTHISMFFSLLFLDFISLSCFTIRIRVLHKVIF